MTNTDDRDACGKLSVRVTDDLVLNTGSWRCTVDDQGRPVAQIAPPPRLMYEQVAAYLESKPSPGSLDVRLADEARAAVAVCLRLGSYLAVLADASRRFSPDSGKAEVSHVHDSEMARLNIEISAAIEWWLMLKGSDEKRYAELVKRAVAYLPLGRKTLSRSAEGDHLKACATRQLSSEVERAWPEHRFERDVGLAAAHAVRAIANTITLQGWRNGPIENVHAGRSAGHALEERRITPKDEKAIVRQAQDSLYAALQAVDYMMFDAAWPPPAERVLPFMRPFLHPRRWSYTERNHSIELPLRDDALPRGSI